MSLILYHNCITLFTHLLHSLVRNIGHAANIDHRQLTQRYRPLPAPPSLLPRLMSVTRARDMCSPAQTRLLHLQQYMQIFNLLQPEDEYNRTHQPWCSEQHHGLQGRAEKLTR